MPRFVALLRGVNVAKATGAYGGVQENVGASGYTDVSTLLNSGNAVFTSSRRSQVKHAASIAAALEQTMDVTTPVIVKSAQEIVAIVSASPITPPETDHSKYLVAFAANEEELLASSRSELSHSLRSVSS